MYHDFKIDDATWLAFDEYLWAQLPHATYVPSVVQLPTPIVTAPGPITASPQFPTATAALPYLISGATGTGIAPEIFSTHGGTIFMTTTTATPIN